MSAVFIFTRVKKKEIPKSNDRPVVQQKSVVKAKVFEPKLWFALLTALAGFILYANTIGHQYVLDDNGIILDNLFVQQGVKGLKGIFSTDVWHFQNVSLGYYRPLSIATFAIEHQFFPQNPHVSHLDNVLLFALTGFFLCLLLTHMFRNYNPVFALLVSLLFMAHPIHTEVVANIKSRDEILSFLNLVIALYILLKAVSGSVINYKALALSCFFYYLALLSKETAMPGVILVPVILFFTEQFKAKEIVKWSLPFVAMVLLFQFQKYEVLGSLSAPAMKDVLNYPYTAPGTTLPSMFLLFAWCIKLLLIPFPLTYSYAYNQIPAANWTSIGAIAGVFLAVGLVYVFYKNMKAKSQVALSVAIVVVTLGPAMLFVLLRGGILGERFLYEPVLGFSIALVWLLFKTSKILPDEQDLTKASKVFVPVAIISCLYSFVTVTRNTDWHDQMTLNAHDATVSTNSCQVHLHYGTVLIDAGTAEKDLAKRNEYFEKGVSEIREAIGIEPHIAEEYHEIGIAYQRIKENYDSALFYYNQAILESPNYAFSYLSLGTLYENTGQDQLASYYYNRGVELNPYFAQGVLARDKHRKRTGLDIKSFPSSNNIDSLETTTPNKDFNFYSEMGQTYGKRGDFVNATRCLEKAVQMNPSSTEALINLSLCYAMQKQYDPSIDALNKALDLEPNNKLALGNLAIIYEHIGNKEKAGELRKRMSELP